MPAQLVAVAEGFRILLDKPILLIGRDAECDIQLESRKVSRRHCCIAQVGDRLVVRDLCSTNGIRINGVRVAEGTLKAGDELTIGNHNYRVRLDALANGAEPPRPAAPRKAAPVPVQARPASDEALESCDEPVPLLEVADEHPPSVPAAAAQAASPAEAPLPLPPADDLPLPFPLPQAADPPGGPPSPPPAAAPHLVLPDSLNLAPISEESLPSLSPRSRRVSG